jgi:shikimate dehydrogenase
MTKTAAVIGHPVSHSLSPDIFSYLAKETGVDLRYEAVDVKPEILTEFIRTQRVRPDLVGFNVTVPHKEKLFSLLDSVSTEARTVGAVNVIEIKNAKWKGHNTDIIGLQDSFQQSGLDLENATVIIMGAGGAARAAAFAAAVEGARRVVISNRNLLKAVQIANDFNPLFSDTDFLSVSDIHNFAGENAKLVIQATSLGMSSVDFRGDERLFSRLLSGPATCAYDLVYRPEQTEFLKMAQAKGFKTITGLSMLIGQALATWEIWFGELQNKNILAEDLAVFLRQKLAAGA